MGSRYAEQDVFPDRMAICFFNVVLVSRLFTFIKLMDRRVEMPVNDVIKLESPPGANLLGGPDIRVTLASQAVFW